MPPASVTLAAGDFFGFFTIATSPVQTATAVTITASWNGKDVTQQLTLMPGVAPDTWTVDPTTTTGSQGSNARVAIAQLQSQDVTFNLTSSNPGVARMAPTVTIPAGSPHAGVLIQTTNPSVPTTVTLSVAGAGVTKTATLTVNPIPPAPLAAPTLLAPAVDARFTANQVVSFDWSDVPTAASYRIQVSSSSAFASTVVDRIVTASAAGIAFTATGDRWWRVRANDAGANPGAWSAARAFRVR